ncbi:MAG TPA: helix-turn-helix transcriptional regulator [Solirubrobacterales bacterium]|nr:helix-turn-helix transcriptional regulator [Solirubrobacterales bacterium]
MSVTEDRFVTAPLDPTGALVTAVGYETVGAEPRDHRGLPSPFLTFIVTLDTPVVIAEGSRERGLDVVVAGLTTEVERVKMPTRQTGLQAAVHPLAARRLFGLPAAELARLSVEGEDVLGRLAPRLRERLAEATGWDERFAIFAEEMGLPAAGADAERGRPLARPAGLRSTPDRRAARGPAATLVAASAPRPEVIEAWRLLTATRGRIRIGELAERVYLSRRRLSTLFAAEFGLTPKEAARTMRFTHAVARIGEGVRGGELDLAAVAAECGFVDQPHLDREFREFADTSPSGWIAEEFPNIQAGGHRYARDWEA